MERQSFTSLPSEILEEILLHLDPPSLIAVSRTNRLIKQLSADAPIIWRQFCHAHFKTWNARHDIAAKFAGPLSDTDWRSLFIQRTKIERKTRALLDHIVRTQHERTRCINEIADFGYDATETLSEEYACPDDAEDVLARRYYANVVLERINREFAINVWKDLSDGKDMPLEKALGAYDVFTRVGEDVDIEVVSEDIDLLAKALLNEYPNFRDLSPRLQASTLASYLRDQGFTGVSDPSYYNLRNSFIGLVIRSSEHPSLPLVSVALYCAIAGRVGLDARPCGFLGHVYTLVYAPKNYDLDGKYKPTSSDELDQMYLDPFRSTTEIPADDLQRVLRAANVPRSKYSLFLRDTTTTEMIVRTAKNVMYAVQSIRQSQAGQRSVQASWFTIKPDMDNAFYAALWAMLLLGPGDQEIGPRQYLPYLLEHFQTHFPWDIPLLTRYVIPRFYDSPSAHELMQFVQQLIHDDATPKSIRTRSSSTVNVVFKVGQMFQHKRYGYEGLITGWDVACDQGESWIENMGVDRLPNGRNQAFYNVLVCDKSIRYVAEENIQPVRHDARPSDALMTLAGRHFKRWDDVENVFVSNIRDEYPDN